VAKWRFWAPIFAVSENCDFLFLIFSMPECIFVSELCCHFVLLYLFCYVLFGTTQKNINRLQRVQNTLARIVAGHVLPRGTHSFDILQDLHWLPIDQRIEFRLAALTYSIFTFSQPAYLRFLLNYHIPTRSLRSANTNLLSVARVCTTFASLGFSIAAPTVWNSLPSSIRSSTSAGRLLKTHCFQQAYCSP